LKRQQKNKIGANDEAAKGVLSHQQPMVEMAMSRLVLDEVEKLDHSLGAWRRPIVHVQTEQEAVDPFSALGREPFVSRHIV